jgi:hypothetical protein
LNAEELSLDEQMKRNVQIMKRALRASALEKKIHKEVVMTDWRTDTEQRF